MQEMYSENSLVSDFKYKDIIYFSYILIIIQSLFFVFFFPNIDYPDASFQLQRIFFDSIEKKNIYFGLINAYKNLIGDVINNNFIIDLVTTGPISYFSMENHMIYNGSNYFSISILQFFNLFMTLISISIFNFLVITNKNMRNTTKNLFLKVNTLYFLYPAVAYLIMGITSDFFIYLFQPFFIYFLYTKKNYLNIMIMAVLFVFVDESVASNMLFFVIYLINIFIVNKSRSYLKTKLLVFNLMLPIIAFYGGTVLINLFGSDFALLGTAKYVQENYGNVWTKLINFLFSSFSLWGVGNYITFPYLYILYFLLLSIILKKSLSNVNENKITFILLFTSIVTIASVILVYPPYSHIRFFTFFIFIIIISFQNYIRKDKYFSRNNDFFIYGLLLFFHNIILIMFYSIKIFITD